MKMATRPAELTYTLVSAPPTQTHSLTHTPIDEAVDIVLQNHFHFVLHFLLERVWVEERVIVWMGREESVSSSLL